jgi:EmrB/QacA subfamily drug resistance transporter
MIPTALAPALGPVLGGLLVTDLSWRWVFYVNVPIGIAAVIFGALFLDDNTQAHPGPFDLTGFVLAAGGVGLLMYGVSEGPLKGWGTTGVLATIAAGVALLVVMVFVELGKTHPLVDLRVYGDRLFRSTSIVLTLGAVGFLGVLFLVALFYQDGLHLTALQSGLNTFPEALGVLIGAQIVSRRLYPVFGPRRIMASGLVFVAAGMAGMAAIGAGTSLWWARALMLVIGAGMSCVFIPAQAASFATISPERTGRASTLFNASRQLGGAVGVAFLTTVLAAAGPTRISFGHLVPNLSAYHAGFLAAAGVALVAAGTAFTVNDADAAGTMVRRGRLATRPSPAPDQQPVPVAVEAS